MMKKLKKGLVIPFAGTPKRKIDCKVVNELAITGPDFKGMKPSVKVNVGDKVSKGQPLLEDKRHSGVFYNSPASGTVKAINRGERRSFQNIVIEKSGDESFSFSHYKGADLDQYTSEELTELLKESGMWVSFRTRPFSKVPSPSKTPSSIFVTAMDTNPLAFDPELFIQQYQSAFSDGLNLLSKLRDVPVHVCSKVGHRFDVPVSEKINLHEFSGPHPSGNVGTHIHFIDPIIGDKEVWSIDYQDVVALGKLLASGEYFSERWISLAGPAAIEPRVIATELGADLSSLVDDEIKSTTLEPRVVSGSVLIGRKQSTEFNYLGYFHRQVSLLGEDRERVFLGWHDAGFNRFSAMRTFFSRLTPNKKFNFGTSTHGSFRAMVPVGAYEKVVPLKVLPTLLLKSLVAGDTDDAQRLGCLQLDEEDLALCTFVDPGKVDYGPLLRKSLDIIEKEG